jgi:uncharacterized caspase-like protein
MPNRPGTAANQAPNDLHYAVVVGINRYPGIRDLKLARRDATEFRRWLVSPDGGGLPRKNVKSIAARPSDERSFTSSREAWPTARYVNDALEDLNEAVKARVRANPASFARSRLYVYASGHGIAPANGTGAVLMADADVARDALGYNIELSLYSGWYVACGLFREVVIFADCCRDRIVAAPGMGPPWTMCQNPYGPTKTALGFATTFATSAFEPTDVKNLDAARGYFTQALLDGLWGGAADPGTGELNTNHLANYVSQSVQALTEKKRFTQQPNMVSDPGNPIVFRAAGSPIPHQPRRRVTLRFPQAFQGRVTLHRGNLSTGKSWSARRGAWKIELDEGLYSAVPAGRAGRVLFKEEGLFRVLAKDCDVQL